MLPFLLHKRFLGSISENFKILPQTGNKEESYKDFAAVE